MFRLEWALAFREMKQVKSLIVLLILNLALGLSGYLTLSTFQDSLKEALRANAKNFLSADVAVSIRRQMQEGEIKILNALIPAGTEQSRMYEFFSMVAAGSDSRLVQIKAIDDRYPLYGALTMDDGRLIESATVKDISTEPNIWVYPELLVQLNLKTGDQIELGGQKFTISGVIKEDSTQTFRMASLAPKIYVGRTQIEKSKLIQFGTTMTDAVFLKFPSATMLPDQIKEMGQKFLADVKDPAIQWTSYIESSEDTGRFMGFLFDYLGLGALVGVSLAGFGLAALIRSWLVQKVKSYGIYNALGLQSSSIRRIFILQLLVLGVGTTLVSMTLIGVALPILGEALKEWVAVDIDIQLKGLTLLKGFLLITLGSIGVTLPFIRQLQDVPTQRLFSENPDLATDFKWSWALLWLPVLIGFWILSVREANSYTLGSIFFGSLVGSYLILALVGFLIFRAISRWGGPWWMRQGFLYLGRKPTLLTTFVALSLGSLLTTLIPQIRAGLYDEIAGNRSQARPSVFLFDIQDDQIDGIKKLAEQNQHQLEHISPLIRARVLTVNDVAYERKEVAQGFVTREEEAEARFRNRGINLSSRAELSTAEKLSEGRWFSPDVRADHVAEISVESRYATRMGFKLGDRVKFDIQGVELETEIMNFREVSWNSFQPNFFVLIQPGAIDDAPKTWLADIANLSEVDRAKFQTLLARQFPNVSAIDVERAIAKALEVMDKMVFALQLMAILTWISGFFVLLSILYRQISIQEWDATLFRLLGASSGNVFRIFQVEFGVLVLTASFFGSLLAVGLSFGLSMQFFEGNFKLDPYSLLLTLGSTMVIAVLLTAFFSWRLSRSNPARVLQGVRI